MFVLLTSSPLPPPARFRVKLETGASGTRLKEVRRRLTSEPFWWIESMKPTRFRFMPPPWSAATRSGSSRSPPLERRKTVPSSGWASSGVIALA
jgi:hypothetical protein